MTFAEHLEELRSRLIFSLIAFGIAFGLSFAFQDELLKLLTRPYRAAVASINASKHAEWARHPRPHQATLLDDLIDALERDRKLPADELQKLRARQEHDRELEAPQLPTDLNAVGIGETFSAYMQVCMLAAALVSAPILLLQVWKFIAAGLYDHEKRTVRRVLPWSLFLFFVGLAFGFLVLANISVQFLVSYGDIEVVRPQVAIGAYLGLLFLLLLVMGLVFQIPLIMTVLSSVGLISPAWFRSKRRHCILAIFVIAAIITPPDYISQLIVAGPMLLLFEMGIYLAAGAAKKRAARLATEVAGTQAQDEKK